MSICGHQKQISALQRNIQNHELTHAYLFVGPEHIGKKTVALSLIKTVQCQEKLKPCGKCSACIQIEKNCHPDTIIVQEEGKIKIEKMREVQQKMSLKAFNSPYKTLLIDNAENLTEEAANSLLKFLEEPKGNALIILIASDVKNILPTIISRCAIVKFFPVAREEILKYCSRLRLSTSSRFRPNNTDNADLEELIHYSQGRPGNTIKWLKNPEEFAEIKQTTQNFKKILSSNKISEKFKFVSKFYHDRQESQKLLSKLLVFYHDLLLSKTCTQNFIVNFSEKEFFQNQAQNLKTKKILKNLSQIASAQKLIAQNANLKLVMENVMLEL